MKIWRNVYRDLQLFTSFYSVRQFHSHNIPSSLQWMRIHLQLYILHVIILVSVITQWILKIKLHVLYASLCSEWFLLQICYFYFDSISSPFSNNFFFD